MQIRKSTFETNSSSSHSFHLDKSTKLLDTIKSTDQNIIVLTGGKFGWEWESYNNALTKANYAAISTSGIDRDLLCEVIQEQTGYPVVIMVNEDTWEHPAYSYIDHESHGQLSEINNKEDLRNWIFNPRCYLYTGNDNDVAPNKFYDMPEQTYTHKLVVKFPDRIMEWEFKNYPSEIELQQAVYALLHRVRYNETQHKWEYDISSWAGWEDYYELSHKFNNIIIDDEIIFIKERLYHIAKEDVCGNNNDEDLDSSYKKIYARLRELENMKKHQKRVKYEIVKL